MVEMLNPLKNEFFSENTKGKMVLFFFIALDRIKQIFFIIEKVGSGVRLLLSLL